MTRYGQSILPERFLSEDADRRFRHADIPTLSASQLWAEVQVRERWLSRNLFCRSRVRVFDGEAIVTDRAWVCRRVRLLRAALSRRLESAT